MTELYTIDEFMNTDFGELKFIRTNCKCMDCMTGGLVEDGIHLITGGSGQGKSIVLMHLAVNIANTRPLLYISLENDIRIDKARMKLALNNYGLNVKDSQLLYVNGVDEKKAPTKNGKKIGGLIEYISVCKDMVIVIDAPEYLTSAKEGMDSFQVGKDLLEKLKKLGSDNHLTFIMSWQLQRGIPRDIKEFTVDYLSTSIAAARIASTVWAVHKADNVTKMKLLKCRTEIYEPFTNIYTICKDNKIDIRCGKDKESNKTNNAPKPTKEELKQQLYKIMEE